MQWTLASLTAARMLLAGLLALAIGSCAVRPTVRVGARRQLGPVQWSRVFSGISPTDAVTATTVQTAGDGLVLGGSLQGATDLGCGPLRSRGGPDGLVGAFSADGACRWAAQIGGAGAQTVVTGVAVDETGVYAAGWFNRTVAAGSTVLASAGGTDGFLVKYTLDGAVLWTLRMGGTTADRALAVGLADGAVIVTGYFTNTASFGGPSVTSAGQTDLFLASYAPDGVPLWSLRAGGAASDEGRGLEGDWLVGKSGTDGFVGRFDAGALRWSQTMPAATFNAVSDGVVVGVQTAGLPAPLVARYDPSGTPLWSHHYTAPTGTAFFGGDFRSVATTTDAIIATGAIMDPIDFGGGPLVAPYTADIVLATFASDGTYQGAIRIPAPFSDYGNGLDVTEVGPVMAGNAQAAAFLSQFAAGGSPTTATVTATATETLTTTPTVTVRPSATPSATANPTHTIPPPTPTMSATVTATATPSATTTATAIATATTSETPTARPTATDSPRPTWSAVPTATATATETAVPTATASQTVTATGTASPAETPTVVPHICDVSRNGAITALDAARILQFIAGLTDLDDEQRLLADASGNGGVSTLDAALILRWVVGQPEAAPRCGRPLHEG